SRLAPLPWSETAPRLTGLPWLTRRSLMAGTVLDVVAVVGEGQLCWASLKLFRDSRVEAACRSDNTTRFLTGTILPSKLVAGVHCGGAAWFRPGRERLRQVAQTQGDFSDAVACFGVPGTNELLVVGRRGDIVRVPVPE